MDSPVPTLELITRAAKAKDILKSLNLTMKDLNDMLVNGSILIDPTNASFPTTTANQSETSLPEDRMCDLNNIRASYIDLHGYLSLIVCIFGTIANILNIVVLTRKEMNGSPINRILTGIAVADMMVMVEYIPTAIHLYLWTDRTPEERLSWSWAAFVWFHTQFSTVIHNVSIWLTLSLAVWRFIMIRYHTLAPVYCTMTRCKILILCAYVIPLFVSLPNCFALSIQETEEGSGLFVVRWSDLARNEEEGMKLLYYINIWLYSFILKLIPCIVLTVITGFLIHALYKAEERSARLKNGHVYRRPSAPPTHHDPQQQNSVRKSVANGAASGQHQLTPADPGTSGRSGASQNRVVVQSNTNNKRKRNTDRTTRLLIAILLLFLLTEFPQGILGLLSAIQGDRFFRQCYLPLGELMDAMALINSAINFILYCIMSKQFRKTFVETFHLQWLQKKLDCKSCPLRSRVSGPGRLNGNTNVVSMTAKGEGVAKVEATHAEMVAMLPQDKQEQGNEAAVEICREEQL